MVHLFRFTTVAPRLLLLSALTAGVLSPQQVEADEDLSGTISYLGAQGPVSDARPLRILIYDDQFFGGGPLGDTTVTVTDGAFVLTTGIAGDYYLFYWLDVNNDFVPSVGEPYELSIDQFDFPALPVTVPQSDVPLAFSDDGLISGIAGSVTYTGNLGPVSAERTICVCAYSNPELSGQAPCIELRASGARYDFIAFSKAFPAYLIAFLDLNSNIAVDPGEPFLIYDNKSAPPADRVAPGPTQTGINFTFGDDYLWGIAAATPSTTPISTDSPTPTNTPTPTSIPCVGDCDHNRTVTASELIEGVEIIAGTVILDDCPDFDCRGDGVANVACLDEAVSAIFAGCGDE